MSVTNGLIEVFNLGMLITGGVLINLAKGDGEMILFNFYTFLVILINF